jgi:hypothetical protein
VTSCDGLKWIQVGLHGGRWLVEVGACFVFVPYAFGTSSKRTCQESLLSDCGWFWALLKLEYRVGSWWEVGLANFA